MRLRTSVFGSFLVLYFAREGRGNRGGGVGGREKETEGGGRFLITQGSFRYGGDPGTLAARWEGGNKGDTETGRDGNPEVVRTFQRPEE